MFVEVVLFCAIVFFLFLFLYSRNYLFGMATDVNSGDVDDTYAITYIVTEGVFVRGGVSYTRAMLRWFIPYIQPYTIKIALEREGDMKLFLKQLSNQMYGYVCCVDSGFLTANYELIQLYQSGYSVVFPFNDPEKYELVQIQDDLKVQLLEISGPTSCVFNTSGWVLYVGRLLLKGREVGEITGANAKELSRVCIERGLENGARISELPIEFSRNILCSLSPNSPLLATAAKLQLNPWAFSFLQDGPMACQFAESNQQIGSLLLAKLNLTYDSLWDRLDDKVREKITNLKAKFNHWNCERIIRNRILWAVINYGGNYPWKSDSHTSVRPPFNDLCSVLNTEEMMTPLELFEFRVQNVASFTGSAKDTVRRVLSHTVLYDLYAVVLLKYGLTAEQVIEDQSLRLWFINHVQTFVDSTSSH